MTKASPPPIEVSLVQEILQSINQVEGYGSVEIFVQDHTITQITVRKIKKTNSRLLANKQKTNNALDKTISIY